MAYNYDPNGIMEVHIKINNQVNPTAFYTQRNEHFESFRNPSRNTFIPDNLLNMDMMQMLIEYPSSKEALWSNLFIKKYTFNKEKEKLGREVTKKLNTKKKWIQAKRMKCLIFREEKGNLYNAMDLDDDEFSKKYNEEHLEEKLSSSNEEISDDNKPPSPTTIEAT